MAIRNKRRIFLFILAAILIVCGIGMRLYVTLSPFILPYLALASSGARDSESITQPRPSLIKTVTISPHRIFTDTGLTVHAGDQVIITATGTVTASTVLEDSSNKWVGPNGW